MGHFLLTREVVSTPGATAHLELLPQLDVDLRGHFQVGVRSKTTKKKKFAVFLYHLYIGNACLSVAVVVGSYLCKFTVVCGAARSIQASTSLIHLLVSDNLPEDMLVEVC